MIRLATVFSGIGAIEHALERMNIDTEIVFACDNGDVDVLSKKIDIDMDQISTELKSLKGYIDEIEFSDDDDGNPGRVSVEKPGRVQKAPPVRHRPDHPRGG